VFIFGPADYILHNLVLSLRLRKEVERLLAPYIALGFDQNVTSENRSQVTVRMGYLQSIEHLSRYGRPMYVNSPCCIIKSLKYLRWNAQFLKGQEDELIDLAGLKLAHPRFLPENRDHVLAVLSQRVCVDTVLTSSEGLHLADRSVANHMRLL
jgi:hypothetical protein